MDSSTETENVWKPFFLLFLFFLSSVFCHASVRADQTGPHVSALFRALNAQDVAKLNAHLRQNPSLVNARQDGQTLLSQAASFDFQNMVVLLLQRGANVNARDSNGDTPLHQAIENGDRAEAAILIKYGGRDEQYPILDAIAHGDMADLTAVLNTLSPDLRKAELQGCDVDEDATIQGPGQKPERVFGIGDMVTGITPLDAAVFWRRRDMVKLLLANGAEINVEDEKFNETPLHVAVGLNDKAMVMLLLAKGADVNAKTVFHGFRSAPVIDRLTALHIAAQSCGSDMVSLLAAHGADVNARDSNGETPLFYAIERGSREIVAALLNRGADPNIRNIEEMGTVGGGETSLHQAVISYDRLDDKVKMAILPIMAMLIAHGANVNAKDKRGLTPLGLTTGNDTRAILLRQHGGKNFGRSEFPLFDRSQFSSNDVPVW